MRRIDAQLELPDRLPVVVLNDAPRPVEAEPVNGVAFFAIDATVAVLVGFREAHDVRAVVAVRCGGSLGGSLRDRR